MHSQDFLQHLVEVTPKDIVFFKGIRSQTLTEMLSSQTIADGCLLKAQRMDKNGPKYSTTLRENFADAETQIRKSHPHDELVMLMITITPAGLSHLTSNVADGTLNYTSKLVKQTWPHFGEVQEQQDWKVWKFYGDLPLHLRNNVTDEILIHTSSQPIAPPATD